jgi:hypothetical protein
MQLHMQIHSYMTYISYMLLKFPATQGIAELTSLYETSWKAPDGAGMRIDGAEWSTLEQLLCSRRASGTGENNNIQ